MSQLITMTPCRLAFCRFMKLRLWLIRIREVLPLWDGRLLRALLNPQMLEYLRGPGWLEPGTRYSHYAEWRRSLEAGVDLCWRLQHPWPCYAYGAIDFLEAWLRPHHQVFEYGCGTSTLWLAQRVGRLVSIEHDPRWSDLVRPLLPPHAQIRCLPPRRGTPRAPEFASGKGPGDYESYVRAIEGECDASLDLVCVDGRARPGCLLASVPKIKPEGILLLDNCHRPRYEPVIQQLIASGWKVERFVGNGPYVAQEQHTALFRRV